MVSINLGAELGHNLPTLCTAGGDCTIYIHTEGRNRFVASVFR
jgi:hypothetical protein